jgi:hypothetical protein
MATPMLQEPGRVLESYEPRQFSLKESDESTTLGQKNGDGNATRTKITHLELGQLGIIGTVFSVTYGSWDGRQAACLALGYSFRHSPGLLRFKSAEISLSFTTAIRANTSNTQSQADSGPEVVFFYPQKHKTSPDESSSHERDTTFSIKGKVWSQRKRDVAHQVFWVVSADSQNTYGIPEQICLYVVVASDTPFEATVGTSAKLAMGVKLQSLPWSPDDPLLFDGITSKGPQMQTRNFEAIDESYWETWTANFLRRGSFTPSTISTSSTSTLAASSVDDEKKAQEDLSQLAFRVRAIPGDWSDRTTIVRLAKLFGITDSDNGVVLLSFACSAFPRRGDKCAVVAFPHGPPQILRKKEKRWIFELRDHYNAESRLVTLVFDLSFEGFTPLGRNINKFEDIGADVIVVPGLGGHAYGSFKERGGSHMWLQDSLATDVHQGRDISSQGYVRILTYGYESHIVNSQSFQLLRDLGGKLQASIREIRSV